MEMDGWLTLCLIFLSTSLALWFSVFKRKPKRQLPPGPWTLPVIGSLHHVISELPHRTLRELSRRYGPMMFLKLGEHPTVVVSNAEAVAEIMKANDAACSNRSTTVLQDIVGFHGKGILFAPYEEHWRQMRKLCMVELLNPKQVKRMEGIRTEQIGNLLSSIITATAAGSLISISDKVASLSNNVVAWAMYGGKLPRQEEYLQEFGRTTDFVGGFYLVDLFPSSWLVRWFSSAERRVKSSCDRIANMITKIVEERKAARAAGDVPRSTEHEDMLDVMLRLMEEDSLAYPLTTEIIVTVLFDMFGGASGSVANTLVWAMSQLLRKPTVMAKVQLEIREVLGEGRAIIGNSDLAELHYLRMVIKEALRMHPNPIITRRTREDCNIMGYDIPKDTNIIINIFAVSRDPQYWEDPEEFNPERFAINNLDYGGTCFQFTPFGGGRRICPGISFASSILEVTLANLLYHFDWTLPGGASSVSLDMSERFGFAVRRRSGLQLKATQHVCSKAIRI